METLANEYPQGNFAPMIYSKTILEWFGPIPVSETKDTHDEWDEDSEGNWGYWWTSGCGDPECCGGPEFYIKKENGDVEHGEGI